MTTIIIHIIRIAEQQQFKRNLAIGEVRKSLHLNDSNPKKKEYLVHQTSTMQCDEHSRCCHCCDLSSFFSHRMYFCTSKNVKEHAQCWHLLCECYTAVPHHELWLNAYRANQVQHLQVMQQKMQQLPYD